MVCWPRVAPSIAALPRHLAARVAPTIATPPGRCASLVASPIAVLLDHCSHRLRRSRCPAWLVALACMSVSRW